MAGGAELRHCGSLAMGIEGLWDMRTVITRVISVILSHLT